MSFQVANRSDSFPNGFNNISLDSDFNTKVDFQ
jgi:hypothetical protein